MSAALLFDQLPARGNGPVLVFFFETDCPTCRLIAPYLNRLPTSRLVGVSQDSKADTERFATQLDIRFSWFVDEGLAVSRTYDPETVPALYVVGDSGRIEDHVVGFEKVA